MKEPTTNHYPRSFGEEEGSHDSPFTSECCAPEENSKVPYPRLHESSYLIYDTAFIPDRWGKFDKPTRDKGKCLFYQDPTRALTYVYDMNGKQTSHIRVPLVRPHAQKKYLKIPASELNAFAGTSPKADKNVDSKPFSKRCFIGVRKGFVRHAGKRFFQKPLQRPSRRVYRCTLWWWMRLDPKPERIWSTPQRNVASPGVESRWKRSTIFIETFPR